MFSKKPKAQRVIRGAVQAVIEQLEQRQLLTTCIAPDASNVFKVFGDDSIGNNIVISYNSTTTRVSVTDSVAGVNAACTNQFGVTEVWAYGGSSSTATSTGADTIDGSGMPDTILLRLFGLDGNDLLKGGGFADWIVGGENDDSIFGGAGNDEIWGNNGADTIRGDAGNDILHGGDDLNNGNPDGNDSIMGGDGNDDIRGDLGNDFVSGESGNDVVRGGEGNDIVWGGSGGDQLFGDSGNDTLGASDSVNNPESGVDMLNGGDGNDLLFGGSSPDELWGDEPGTQGNDTIWGGDGSSDDSDDDMVMYEGRSDDLYVTIDDIARDGAVSGWAAISTASRSSNVVTINTGTAHGLSVGNTVIIIGVVPNSFNGVFTVASTPTSSTFTYSQTGSNQGAKRVGSFAKSVELDDVRHDVEIISAGEGDDWLAGSDSHAETLRGEGGNDSMRGGAQADVFWGGAGSDWVDYNERTADLTIRMDAFDPLDPVGRFNLCSGGSSGSGVDGAEGDCMTVDVENVLTGSGNDSITDLVTNLASETPVSVNNIFVGGDGNDTLVGFRGDDFLVGMDGNDKFDCGSSSDGADSMYGGDGTDLVDYHLRTNALTITIGDTTPNDGESGESDYITSEMENVKGGDGSDTISVANDSLPGASNEFWGNGGTDELHGGNGNDTLHDGGGWDKLYGEAGNDVLDSSGNDGASLYGGAGADSLTGDEGTDFMDGGDDNDLLHGNGDSDSMNGGNGDDSLYGDAGADSMHGGEGIDSLFGGTGQDSLWGDNGNDFLAGNTYNSTEGEADYLDGGGGTNGRLDFDDADTALNFPPIE